MGCILSSETESFDNTINAANHSKWTSRSNQPAANRTSARSTSDNGIRAQRELPTTQSGSPTHPLRDGSDGDSLEMSATASQRRQSTDGSRSQSHAHLHHHPQNTATNYQAALQAQHLQQQRTSLVSSSSAIVTGTPSAAGASNPFAVTPHQRTIRPQQGTPMIGSQSSPATPQGGLIANACHHRRRHHDKNNDSGVAKPFQRVAAVLLSDVLQQLSYSRKARRIEMSEGEGGARGGGTRSGGGGGASSSCSRSQSLQLPTKATQRKRKVAKRRRIISPWLLSVRGSAIAALYRDDLSMLKAGQDARRRGELTNSNNNSNISTNTTPSSASTPNPKSSLQQPPPHCIICSMAFWSNNTLLSAARSIQVSREPTLYFRNSYAQIIPLQQQRQQGDTSDPSPLTKTGGLKHRVGSSHSTGAAKMNKASTSGDDNSDVSSHHTVGSGTTSITKVPPMPKNSSKPTSGSPTTAHGGKPPRNGDRVAPPPSSSSTTTAATAMKTRWEVQGATIPSRLRRYVCRSSSEEEEEARIRYHTELEKTRVACRRKYRSRQRSAAANSNNTTATNNGQKQQQLKYGGGAVGAPRTPSMKSDNMSNASGSYTVSPPGYITTPSLGSRGGGGGVNAVAFVSQTLPASLATAAAAANGTTVEGSSTILPPASPGFDVERAALDICDDLRHRLHVREPAFGGRHFTARALTGDKHMKVASWLNQCATSVFICDDLSCTPTQRISGFATYNGKRRDAQRKGGKRSSSAAAPSASPSYLLQDQHSGTWMVPPAELALRKEEDLGNAIAFEMQFAKYQAPIRVHEEEDEEEGCGGGGGGGYDSDESEVSIASISTELLSRVNR